MIDMKKKYFVIKAKKNNEIVYLDYKQISGYDLNPKNTNRYGISIKKIIIVNPSLIKKLLIKKTNIKINMFLKKILSIIEDDDSDDETIREALNHITRYKNIINYRYKKFLEDKFVTKLNAQLNILEQELKRKRMYVENSAVKMRRAQQAMIEQLYRNQLNNNYEEEKTSRRTR